MNTPKGLTTITAALLLILALPAHAGNDVGQTYVMPSAAYVDGDKDRLVDDGLVGGGLTAGYAYHPNWNIEAFVHRAEPDGPRSQNQTEFGVNVLSVFNREGIVSPFLLLGASALSIDEDNGNDSDTGTANYGGGVFLNLTDSMAVRAEYRYRASLGDGNLRDQVVSLGLQFGFGGDGGRFSDTDGDGVSDMVDRCPDTRPGAEVDSFGCELDDDGDGVARSLDLCPDSKPGVPVDANGCELDGDGDGVGDSIDQCPRTPAGATVDARGCELDGDGDGVVDRLDRCPGTRAGVRVDVNGCEIREVIRLPGVRFETNSDRLVPGAEQVLNDAAATLRKHPDLVVEVAGHTDSDGAAAYNAGLSERRAKTVMNYLVANGADPANLAVRGYGETQPIADNSTAVGKAANRRVELRILNEQ